MKFSEIVDIEEAFTPPRTNPPIGELERCSEFSSAEAYADSYHNQYRNPRNPNALRAYNQEAERLKSSWNYYNKLGLIKPKPRGLSRFI